MQWGCGESGGWLSLHSALVNTLDWIDTSSSQSLARLQTKWESRMDHGAATQAKELHRNLEFIGLRAQATSVGLIQLCAELVKAGVLNDVAIQRIKDAIYRDITVSRPRTGSSAEFERTLWQRLDAIFPKAGDVERRAGIGNVADMEQALDPEAKGHIA